MAEKSFLDGLVDSATGIANKLIDLDLKRFELQLFKQAKAQEQARAIDNAPVPTGGGLSTMNLVPLLLIGGAGVGAYLLLRR